MDIYYTVDTEVAPSLERKLGIKEAYLRSISGATRDGDFGIPYQANLLKKHDIIGTFFVEPLFSYGGNGSYLKEIVDLLIESGQDVQLHIHTEWLQRYDISIRPLPGHSGAYMADYSLDDQHRIIELSLELLKKYCSTEITSFRAGNYGANLNTLKALRKSGILYDSSYNYTYLGKGCSIEIDDVLTQPKLIEGIYEFPVSFFKQSMNSFRHLQLVACSKEEIENSIFKAKTLNYNNLVIVSHSFELYDRNELKPISIVIERFKHLCNLIHENDSFEGKSFSQIYNPDIDLDVEMISSDLFTTAKRYYEQGKKRLFK